MTTTKLLKSLLISALLASVTAQAAEQQPIVIAMEEGKQIVSFKIGDSHCVLKDESAATMLRQCALRNTDQDVRPPRSGAGSMPSRLRTLAIVPRPTSCPRL